MGFPGLLARVAAVLLPLAGWVVLTTGQAQAACAGVRGPSPHPFTGTVVALADGGRVATVVTAAGGRVRISGGAGAEWSSVDRFFTRGVRYEFHPTDARAPFRDSVCTATRRVGLGAPAPIPEWVPLGVVFVGGATAAGSLGVVLRRNRRAVT